MTRKRRLRHPTMAAVSVMLTAALGISGCTASASQQPAGTPPPRSAPASPALPPTTPNTASRRPLAHVVIIVEENKPASSIIGNPSAPYLSSLAGQLSPVALFDDGGVILGADGRA